MTTAFPGAVDVFTTRTPGGTISSSHVNDLQDAVSAIETTLGVNPQGVAATVAARILAVEGTAAGAATAASVTTLAGRVTTVEAVAAAAATAASVTTLTGRVTTVEGVAAGAATVAGAAATASSVTALDGRVTTVEGVAAAAATDAEVAVIEGRVTTVEGVAAAAATAASVTALGPRLLPAAGTTGQVLSKASNTDYDVAWAAAGTGGGGEVTPPWVSNRYYGVSPGASVAASAALNSFYAAPIYIPNSIAIDSLTFEVTTASGAGGVVRLGIYNTGTDGLPGTLVCETPTIASTSTGIKTGAVSVTIPAAGWYWVGGVVQVSLCTWRAISNWQPLPLSGFSAPGTGAVQTGFAATDGSGLSTSVTGALPTAFTAPGQVPNRATASPPPPRVYIHTT